MRKEPYVGALVNVTSAAPPSTMNAHRRDTAASMPWSRMDHSRPLAAGSLMTLRWRKPDSNPLGPSSLVLVLSRLGKAGKSERGGPRSVVAVIGDRGFESALSSGESGTNSVIGSTGTRHIR
jgi:hypothetical protein